jgi:predicted phage terminase large subunit-like protein
VFEAHNEDFSEILWPEKFSEKRLKQIRQSYIDQGIPEGYSQEYLNKPLDEENAYFKKDDFLEIPEGNHSAYNFYIGADFAISKEAHADETSFTVGGMTDDRFLDIVYNSAGRWDSLEIVDEIFRLHVRFTNAQGIAPMFFFEQGALNKALGPFLEEQMLKRGMYLNIEAFVPVRDKMTRARSFQARMRGGGVRFKKDSEWYEAFHHELLQFPRGKMDNRVDSSALIGLGLDKMITAPDAFDLQEDAWREEYDGSDQDEGRNPLTGY